MSCMLWTLSGVADMYIFLMNTWNTLPESYQQKMYNNTLATVKRQIQQAGNPTPGVVISVEAARVNNGILIDHLTSEVVLGEPKMGSTDPNIPMGNNCMSDKLHFGMPGGCGDYEDEGDDSNKRHAIPMASRWRRAVTELERFDLGTSDVDGYEGEDGDDADADEEEEASQADDGSIQNVKDWGHCRFDLGTSDVDGYDGEDGDVAVADEEEDAL